MKRRKQLARNWSKLVEALQAPSCEEIETHRGERWLGVVRDAAAPFSIGTVLLAGDAVLSTGSGGVKQTALGGSSDGAQSSAMPFVCCVDQFASFQVGRLLRVLCVRLPN